MIVTRETEARAAAAHLTKGQPRYEAVEALSRVPWTFVAVLHHRESGGNFHGVLHNGERIIGTGRKTRLVPSGRGPFASWEEAAVDALMHKGFDKVTDWSLERMCFCAESFNGWGYRNRGLPSPYLWAGSDIYLRGKYVTDGKFDASVVDRQLGCMVVHRYLTEQNEQRSVPQSADAVSVPHRAPVQVSWLETLIRDVLKILRRQ